MSTIDEILAAGWYTDKRGRSWRHLPLSGRWADQVIDHQGIHWAGQKIEADQMRLLIERDQHRDVCRGLDSCTSHPVPHVLAGRAHARVFTVVGRHFESRYGATLTEAIDAARALAVGS